MKSIEFIENIHKIYFNHFFSKPVIKSNSYHIDCAVRWLCLAQDKTNNGGLSEGYHLYHGWLPSYPETTGYIIETFFDYFHQTGDQDIMSRAVKMADWLISIQYDDGAIPDSYFQKRMVFDTGQVIFGLVRSYKETAKEVYKEAAIKAGNWLLNVQEEDGSWKKHAINSIPHTYYTRVAWSLLALHKITKQNKYIEACSENIEWALQQQNENGWFQNASFNLKNHDKPFTHTIAYSIRGILEAGIYLKNDKYITAVLNSMDNLLVQISHNGFIAGTYNKNWEGNKAFSCLTGSAQLSIIFLKLADIMKSDKYFSTGTRINNYLKSYQNTSTNNLNIRGAIAGSAPIWSKYIHFTYPNWATKFFIDALMLQERLSNKL
jgi:hypothetical protein